MTDEIEVNEDEETETEEEEWSPPEPTPAAGAHVVQDNVTDPENPSQEVAHGTTVQDNNGETQTTTQANGTLSDHDPQSLVGDGSGGEAPPEVIHSDSVPGEAGSDEVGQGSYGVDPNAEQNAEQNANQGDEQKADGESDADHNGDPGDGHDPAA